jgi:hypothetical protein
MLISLRLLRAALGTEPECRDVPHDGDDRGSSRLT